MSNSSWWEKRLGSPNPQPASPRTSSYPPSPPPPARLAPTPPPVAPNVQVTPSNFAEVSTQWHGGEASQRETGSCPNCGSNLYFSRSNAGGLISESGGTVAPAPRCYACGYTYGRDLQGVPPA